MTGGTGFLFQEEGGPVRKYVDITKINMRIFVFIYTIRILNFQILMPCCVLHRQN